MSNLVVHFEIHASEPQRLIDFYSTLFGWTFMRFGEMDYWAIDTGEGSIQAGAGGTGINGGLTQRQGPAPAVGGPVTGANIVVEVADVDASFRKGIELGGTEALAPSDLPRIGRLAYLLDLDNNVVGLITSAAPDSTAAAAPAGTTATQAPPATTTAAAPPVTTTTQAPPATTTAAQPSTTTAAPPSTTTAAPPSA